MIKKRQAQQLNIGAFDRKTLMVPFINYNLDFV